MLATLEHPNFRVEAMPKTASTPDIEPTTDLDLRVAQVCQRFAAGEGIVYRRGAFNALQRRELLRLARLVAREMLQRGSRATGAITFAQMKFWCAIVFGAER